MPLVAPGASKVTRLAGQTGEAALGAVLGEVAGDLPGIVDLVDDGAASRAWRVERGEHIPGLGRHRDALLRARRPTGEVASGIGCLIRMEMDALEAL